MKAHVNEACIACGLCPSICPAVFSMSDAGPAVAREDVPADQESLAREAADSCPVNAIEIQE